MNRTRVLGCLLAVTALLGAACSRSSSDVETTTTPPGSQTTTSAETGTTQSTVVPGTALADGGFGDLAHVCGPGNASGATATGVTDTEIRVGTLSDKGAQIKPGLTKEMYDAAVAFTTWCNEKGGILGRQLKLDDLDAALFNYGAVITAACPQDFALVGGGAVFDDADNGERVSCGLANIAGYVVSLKARVAGLQVQPLPNPVYTEPVGAYHAVERIAPGGLQAYGVLTGATEITQVVRDTAVESVQLLGGKVVYNSEYQIQGEDNWTPFVQDMEAKGVRVLEFVGEPENLEALQSTMATVGWYPEVTILATNFYEQKYLQEGGANAKDTYVRSAFYPFETAADNKATQDYLDLMAQYNPGGKVALLGAQSISAYLLFAQAATACGSNLTTQCLLDKASVTGWTGGGLHASSDPGTNTPTQCVAMFKVVTDHFELDTAATDANEGIFNCGADNLVTLQNDYGVPRP